MAMPHVPAWLVPSTENLIAVAPVDAALKQAVLAGHDAAVVELVIIGAAGFEAPSMVSDCVTRPTLAPVELSMAALVTVPPRRPPQVTVTDTRLRSLGWLSA